MNRFTCIELVVAAILCLCLINNTYALEKRLMLLDQNISLEHYIHEGNVTLSFKSNVDGYMIIGFNKDRWCPGDIVRVSYNQFPIIEDMNCKHPKQSYFEAEHDLYDGGKNDWYILSSSHYDDKGWIVKATRRLITKDGDRDAQIDRNYGLSWIQWAYSKYSSDFEDIPDEQGQSNLDRNAHNVNTQNPMRDDQEE